MTISTIGLILALATALAVTLKDRKIKKLKDVKLSSYSSALFMFLAALPIIAIATAIAIFLEGKLPILEQNFWIALAVNSPLIIFANYFYIKAYRGKENFSAIAPLNSITPIGTIIIAFIVLGRIPTFLGVFGVLTIIAGLYLLGVSKIDSKISSTSLTPFKMIFSSKEARYMLIAVFIWMITSVFDGLGIYGIVGSPLTQALVWVLIKTIISSLILLLICFHLYRHELRFKIFFKKKILYLGLFYSLENILHMAGVAVWDVVFIVTIKRLSILFNVLIGIFRDKDPGGWKRILAALIAIIGFTIIKIASS